MPGFTALPKPMAGSTPLSLKASCFEECSDLTRPFFYAVLLLDSRKLVRKVIVWHNSGQQQVALQKCSCESACDVLLQKQAFDDLMAEEKRANFSVTANATSLNPKRATTSTELWSVDTSVSCDARSFLFRVIQP